MYDYRSYDVFGPWLPHYRKYLLHHGPDFFDRTFKYSAILPQEVKDTRKCFLFHGTGRYHNRMENVYDAWIVFPVLWHLPSFQIIYQDSLCIPLDPSSYRSILKRYTNDSQTCQQHFEDSRSCQGVVI